MFRNFFKQINAKTQSSSYSCFVFEFPMDVSILHVFEFTVDMSLKKVEKEFQTDIAKAYRISASWVNQIIKKA